MGVIFDLDQTLLNTQSALEYRDSGKWPQVYDMIPSFTIYDGILPLINELAELGVPMCIVTSSPSIYCKRTLAHHGISLPNMVCFHDTKLRKPHPEPIQKALKILNLTPSNVISIGDDPKDIHASRSAGVFSVGATWGSLNKEELVNSNPDALCENVSDLRNLILEKLKLV